MIIHLFFYFTAAPECDAGQWSCSAYKFNNTNCIPNHHRCDKEVDCHDQSDEQNCSKLSFYIFLLDTLEGCTDKFVIFYAIKIIR